MGRDGRLATGLSSSSSESSSSVEARDSEGWSWESREKSSREAGSDGDVMMSGDLCSREAVPEAAFEVPDVLDASRDLRVGRLGVDLDWKPLGTGREVLPLLCGGILDHWIS